MINKNPTVGTVAALLIIGFGLWVVLRQTAAPATEPRLSVFYSADDGKTFFKDSIGKPLPFEHEGKPAVRAYVFTPDGGATRVVGVLEKHSLELHKEFIAAGQDIARQGNAVAAAGPAGILLKRPGEPTWVRADDPKALQIRNFKGLPGAAMVLVSPADD